MPIEELYQKKKHVKHILTYLEPFQNGHDHYIFATISAHIRNI